jgi:hypothetical protein
MMTIAALIAKRRKPTRVMSCRSNATIKRIRAINPPSRPKTLIIPHINAPLMKPFAVNSEISVRREEDRDGRTGLSHLFGKSRCRLASKRRLMVGADGSQSARFDLTTFPCADSQTTCRRPTRQVQQAVIP